MHFPLIRREDIPFGVFLIIIPGQEILIRGEPATEKGVGIPSRRLEEGEDAC